MLLTELFETPDEPMSPEVVFARGVLLLNGLGIDPDAFQALSCFLAAAEGNLPAAQYAAGKMLIEGRGVNQNVERGLALVKQACNQEFIPALLYLSIVLQEQGLIHESFELLLRAARRGVPIAAEQVARAFEVGEGVSPDKSQALEWYERAAKLGDPEACHRLASAYELGQLNLTVSKDKAGFWQGEAEKNRAKVDNSTRLCIINAARNGHKSSQELLAKMFELGAYGAPVNLQRAQFWKARSMEVLDEQIK